MANPAEWILFILSFAFALAVLDWWLHHRRPGGF